MRQLGLANDKYAYKKEKYIKEILKVSEILDSRGEFELADKIDRFAEEFLNEY